MTNEDAIKYLQQLYPYGGHCWLDKQRTEAIGMAIQALQEEPVGEDLEEAIDAYLATYFGSEKEKQEWPFLKKMAIHFAEWQREQMLKDAVEGKVLINGMGNPILHLWDKGKHLIDKKVKVILIKEE